MSPHDFIAKWSGVELKERSASQSHFNDLRALLGLADPITADRSLQQRLRYASALDSPPFLIVSDRDRIRIHTNWTNTAQEMHAFARSGHTSTGSFQA
jgi:hypothetical protein